MGVLLLLALLAAPDDFLAPLGKGVTLPDGETFDMAWLQAMVNGHYPTLVRYGPPFLNDRPQVFTNGHIARWLDDTGALWLHLEADQRKRLHGDVLHVPIRPPGKRCAYAAQFAAGRREGWQVYSASGFAICTRYAKDKPVVTYEIRGGKVLATWAHDSTAGPPNAGIAAKFKSAESEYAELMKKVLPERRKLVAKWVDQVREANRRALGPVKRDEAIKRDELYRQKSNKSHQLDRLRHERMQGRP